MINKEYKEIKNLWYDIYLSQYLPQIIPILCLQTADKSKVSKQTVKIR